MNKKYIAFMIVVMIAISALAPTASAFTLGQRGQEVSDIQLTIIEAGFDIPAITSGVAQPGYFGIQTQKALSLYEASQGTPSLKLGAVPTLDGIDTPYVRINGLQQYWFNTPFVATSSVACSIKNPYSATSTLLNYSVRVTTNNLGSQRFDVSTSSTPIASSTPAFLYNTPTGTIPFALAWFANGTSTNSILVGTNRTSNNAQTDVIIGPSDYVTLRYATSTPSAYTTYNVGTCSGVFQRM